MKKRGRPAHPDILTPREWEALDLIRQGQSNEQIAQRMGISMDGAKYHVSEILSKLGVSSRQEAASWQRPAARPRWAAGLAPVGWLLQRLTLRTAMTAAGASVIIAGVSGLAFLGWAVLTIGTADEQSAETPAVASGSGLEGYTSAARALTERIAAAYEDRDADAIAALFATDGSWDAISSGRGHWQGRDAIRAEFREWFTNVLPPNRTFEYEILIADEHTVVGSGRTSGPKTGRRCAWTALSSSRPRTARSSEELTTTTPSQWRLGCDEKRRNHDANSMGPCFSGDGRYSSPDSILRRG